ncbi:DUF3054 domain-containing protein [Natrononativus amylolyticus]|uniref:DUF3054 domain-containing protein n=1 Tax=Natrononativus amylolyticus TaxID=2963434 RepID=UPI0020CEFDA0|nr:DUF3054 domain-containing protein [Natrononativus amylolyticus]
MELRSRTVWPARPRETLFLAVVDVGLIALLVVGGVIDHGGNPLAAPLSTVETILPFVLGWLALSPLAGAYRAGIGRDPARAARVAAVSWIAAANVGLILRSSPLFDGGSGWPFNLIMTGLGLLLLVGWRVGYAAVTDSR